VKTKARKVRGVYEKVPGSGVWWIQFFDSEGRRRREKAGTRGSAIDLYRKRKQQALEKKKLPERLRVRLVRFDELAKDAEAYCKANNQGQQFDVYRIGRLKQEFGGHSAAAITIENFRKWFDEQEWRAGTYNRNKTTLSLIYRLGIENGKVQSNPAKLLKHKREDNGRVRFLNQFLPAKTDVDYLKPHTDEEARLRAVIAANYAFHMPEFDIALHTGMRPSEQYGLVWAMVDLVRKLVTIPTSKNGKPRHIPLNSIAVAAFQVLQRSLKHADKTNANTANTTGLVFVNIHGEPLRGYKHWFNPAVSEAGIRDFTWYCLRHSFASRLVMAGVDLRTVAELMGHKTIQMTMRYAHLAPAHRLAAVERLVSQPATLSAPSATISATGPEAENLESGIDAS
jgi:site-specific recombinase XerD